MLFDLVPELNMSVGDSPKVVRLGGGETEPRPAFLPGAGTLAEEWRKQGQFLDMLLHAGRKGHGDGGVAAHALVLASAATPVLRDLLVAAHAQAPDPPADGQVHLILADVAAEDIEDVIDWIYSGQGRDLVLKEERYNYWSQWLNLKSLSKGAKKEGVEVVVETPSEAKVETKVEAEVKEEREVWTDGSASRQNMDVDDHEDGAMEGMDMDQSDDEVDANFESLMDASDDDDDDDKHEVLWPCELPDCHETWPPASFEELLKHFDEHHKDLRRKLVCEICTAMFKNKEEFLRHSEGIECQPPSSSSVQTTPIFKCAECPVRRHGFRNFEIHVNAQHRRRTLPRRWALFPCESCLKVFFNLTLLHDHQKKQHKFRPGHFKEDYAWERDVAKRKEKNESKKSNEAGTVDPLEISSSSVSAAAKENEYFCKTCQRNFQSRTGFFQHLRRHHQNESSFQCRRCDKRFPTKFVYLDHRKTCGRSLPCDLCDKKFSCARSLANHVTTIHEERKLHEKVVLEDGSVRFKCDLCSKLFAANQNVYRHKDGVHTPKAGPRKYNCQEEGCTYKTNVLQNFNEHMRTHRPAGHICDVCGAGFITVYNLRKHKTISHSDGDFLCDLCPKTYTNALSLKTHRKTHNEKNLPCHICGKRFRISQELKQHMLSHSDLRPHACDLCQSSFKTKNKLDRHRKGHCKLSRALAVTN